MRLTIVSDWKEFFRQMWRRFWENRVLDNAAMLSFYFFLSVFPLLLFLVALLGLVLRSGRPLHEALQDYLATVTPNSASKLLDHTLSEVAQRSNGSKLWLGLLFGLWAASKGMLAMMGSLNIAYGVRETRRWWKRRLLGLALTLGVVMLMAAAFALQLYGGQLAKLLAGGASSSGFILGAWRVLRWLMLLGFVLLAFDLIYVFAPNVKPTRRQWLMPGSIVGTGLWLLGSYGFKLYLHDFNRYSMTYGSIGAVIVLLLWFYFSGIAILMGGEVNSLLAITPELDQERLGPQRL